MDADHERSRISFDFEDDKDGSGLGKLRVKSIAQDRQFSSTAVEVESESCIITRSQMHSPNMAKAVEASGLSDWRTRELDSITFCLQ
jgi:hypothetical protein